MRPPQLAAHKAGPRGKARWPEILFLITRSPRTVRQIAEFTGCARQTVQEVVERLMEEGLVERSTKKVDSGSNVWAYQFEWVGPPTPKDTPVCREQAIMLEAALAERASADSP